MDTDQTPTTGHTTGTDTGSTIANTGGRNMDTRHDNETRTLSGAKIQVTAIGQTRYGRSGNATDSFRMVVGIDLLTGDPVSGVPVAERDLIDIARNLGYDVTGFIAPDQTDDADTTARDGAEAGTPRLDGDGAGDDATGRGTRVRDGENYPELWDDKTGLVVDCIDEECDDYAIVYYTNEQPMCALHYAEATTGRRDGAEIVHDADHSIPCATLDQLSAAITYMRDEWGDYGYRLGYAGSDRFVGRHSDGSVFTFHIDRYGNHYGTDRGVGETT